MLHQSISLTAGQLEPGASYPGIARKLKVYRWPGLQPGPADSPSYRPAVAGHTGKDIVSATIQPLFRGSLGLCISSLLLLICSPSEGQD